MPCTKGAKPTDLIKCRGYCMSNGLRCRRRNMRGNKRRCGTEQPQHIELAPCFFPFRFSFSLSYTHRIRCALTIARNVTYLISDDERNKPIYERQPICLSAIRVTGNNDRRRLREQAIPCACVLSS